MRLEWPPVDPTSGSRGDTRPRPHVPGARDAAAQGCLGRALGGGSAPAGGGAAGPAPAPENPGDTVNGTPTSDILHMLPASRPPGLSQPLN